MSKLHSDLLLTISCLHVHFVNWTNWTWRVPKSRWVGVKCKVLMISGMLKNFNKSTMIHVRENVALFEHKYNMVFVSRLHGCESKLHGNVANSSIGKTHLDSGVLLWTNQGDDNWNCGWVCHYQKRERETKVLRVAYSRTGLNCASLAALDTMDRGDNQLERLIIWRLVWDNLPPSPVVFSQSTSITCCFLSLAVFICLPPSGILYVRRFKNCNWRAARTVSRILHPFSSFSLLPSFPSTISSCLCFYPFLVPAAIYERVKEGDSMWMIIRMDLSGSFPSFHSTTAFILQTAYWARTSMNSTTMLLLSDVITKTELLPLTRWPAA